LPGLVGLAAVALLFFASAALSATLVLTGPEDAAVSLNGEGLGHFPLTQPLTLPAGNYRVRCVLHGYQPFEEEVLLEDDSHVLRVRIRLIPYSRQTAITSNLLLAGLGQHYLDKRAKGWLFNAVEIGGLVTALVSQVSFQNHRDDYLLSYERYQNAVPQEEAEAFRLQAAQSFTRMEDAEKLRNTALIVAAGAVVVSLLDAWLFFPSITVGPGPVPPPGASRAGLAGDEDGGGLSGLATCHAAWCARF